MLCCLPPCMRRWFSRGKERRKAISQQTRMQIAYRQGYVCPICRKSLSSAWDVDHIIRLADNGSNNPSNLQVICTSCHRIKTAKENSKDSRGPRGQERICTARSQGYKCASCKKKLPPIWKNLGSGIVCAACKNRYTRF